MFFSQNQNNKMDNGSFSDFQQRDLEMTVTYVTSDFSVVLSVFL